ncbi:hypothetical protein Lesp02_20040 [Lentzea sp. NBRC 105346]|uniref:AfsA-related hotdog domain-containing protein n=1 Tax=Lentzea sp. NBRC 105346 TaxID=3032205 RepID=UPI0024A0022F|nr:AfsA-related hotdog domain-containing protein [Lentzea sp. NBRC 105346]GLZ29814.1 hypothetical protein Lesp02_20040 [Lentzea sp. NBRC 105346]
MKAAIGKPLVSGVRRECGGGWLANLNVDRSDPFFYDHPLDHVPGILLVCGLLDLVGHASGSPGPRLRLSLGFPAFCEHDDPVELVATPSSEAVRGRWEVSAVQRGRSVCEGWIGHLGRPEPAGVPGAESENAPIRAELVHRVNPDNIAIGTIEERDGNRSVPVLPPKRGHFLERCDNGTHSAEKLIEAARQATTMIPIEFGGHPADSKFLWLSVAADLPHGVPSRVPTALRFGHDHGRGSRYRFLFELVTGDAVLGRLVSECAVMTAGTYAALRPKGAGA